MPRLPGNLATVLNNTVETKTNELLQHEVNIEELAETVGFIASNLVSNFSNPNGSGHIRNCKTTMPSKHYAHLFGKTGTVKHSIRFAFFFAIFNLLLEKQEVMLIIVLVEEQVLRNLLIPEWPQLCEKILIIPTTCKGNFPGF
jgi:hypothetical protein